jgi:hypothetical protein
LGAEINIHFPRLRDLDKPAVLVFPTLVVCLDCGFTEFILEETEIPLLRKRARAGVERLRTDEQVAAGNRG